MLPCFILTFYYIIYRTRPLSPIEFIFNENLVDNTSGKLLPNKITVDNLTIDWLRNRLTELETSLNNIQANRQTPSSNIETCDTKYDPIK